MFGSDKTAILLDIADSEMQKFSHKGLLYSCDDDEELQDALKVLSEVDMNLAYSSKKLLNLENLLQHVLTGENNIESINFENDNISAEFIENAFMFDLLYTVLNSELREFDNLLANLQALIVNALHKISSSERSTELLTRFGSKLHDSEDWMKQSQDRVLEMTIQLAKLQMTSFMFRHNDYKHNLATGIKHRLHLARTQWNHEFSTSEQSRVLRMLELSLASEVELEKRLACFKQNEEDLKVKIRLIEQVGVCMEEAAEVAWGQFLEADNAAAVLMGISKETMQTLQTLQVKLIDSTESVGQLKSKLHHCINQLNDKEMLIQKLNSRIAEVMSDNAEVTGLREQVQSLEQKLCETESQLTDANASYEVSQQQLKVMEGEIESLRGDVYAAESRAGNAEEKVTHLTDLNLELTEELDFLKGNNESSTKKVSVLEKQLREFDIQLQHARASSEAGQEQQNMLYSAIWDMETLIDELKQKVVSSEGKLENAEEQRVLLSESNKKLKKELDFLRSKMECMGASLDEASLEKQSSAEDISIRTRLIMDMVVQLAIERERIQKQLASLTKENKILRERLQKEQSKASMITQNGLSCNDTEFRPSQLPDLSETEPANNLGVKVNEVSSKNFQVEEPAADATLVENESSSSNPKNHCINPILKPEAKGIVETSQPRRMYTFMATLVLLLSILAAHLLHRKFKVYSRVES